MAAAQGRRREIDLAAVDDVAVLRWEDELDIVDCPALDRRLRAAGPFLVVDLTGVTLMSATVLGVLIAHTERLAAEGGRLVVVPGNPAVRTLLSVTGADRFLDLRTTPQTGGETQARAAHGDVLSQLRRRLRTQPTIARALGILQERYDVTDERQAFEVFRTSSQRHNLRLHTLATAFLAAVAPRQPHGGPWFPDRKPAAPPRLTFTNKVPARERNRAVLLDAVLDSVAAALRTQVVDLRLIEPGERAPILARHRGLTGELVEQIESGTDPGTVVAEVLRRRTRVVVSDVAADPILTDLAERTVLLAAGCRALQCSPLTTAAGRVVGTVTSYHPRLGRTLTAAEHSRLDVITSEAGAWLSWHQDTVVLDALEDVHGAGRAAAAARDRR